MVINIREVLGAGSCSGTGRACEVDCSSGSSVVIKGLEEWWSLEACAALQRGLDSWEKWAERNLWKSRKGKCRSCSSRGWGNLWESVLWRRAGVVGQECIWVHGMEFQKSGVLAETEGFGELQRHQNSCSYKSQQRTGFFWDREWALKSKTG